MQDNGGNSGRPASAGSFQNSSKGFATPEQWNNVNLEVAAPLNVQAAPVSAQRLAAALSQFQQTSSIGLDRAIYATAETQEKQGGANPAGRIQNADGSYSFDFKSLDGQTAAYKEGSLRAGATAAAQDTYTQFLAWKEDPNNNAYQLTPQQLSQKFDDMSRQNLGGLQDVPVAKEEIAPLLQHWHETITGQAQQEFFQKEHQDILDNAYVKAQTLMQTPQGADWSSLIDKNLLSATQGDKRQANLLAIDIAGRIDMENGNTAALDSLKKQVGGRPVGGFGMEANDRWDARYKSAEEVQTKNAAVQLDAVHRQTVMGFEHSLINKQAIPTFQLDKALGDKRLTDSEYEHYMERNAALIDKVDRNAMVHKFVASNGGTPLADLEGRSPGKGKDGYPAEPIKAEEIQNYVGEILDNTRDAKTRKPLDPNQRAVQAIALAKTTKVWDANLQDRLRSLDMTNQKDVKFANDWYTAAQIATPNLLGQLKIPPEKLMDIYSVQSQIQQGRSTADIAKQFSEADDATRKLTGDRLKREGGELLQQTPDPKINGVAMSKLTNPGTAWNVVHGIYSDALASGRFNDAKAAWDYSLGVANSKSMIIQASGGRNVYALAAGPFASMPLDQAQGVLTQMYRPANIKNIVATHHLQGDGSDLFFTTSPNPRSTDLLVKNSAMDTVAYIPAEKVKQLAREYNDTEVSKRAKLVKGLNESALQFQP